MKKIYIWGQHWENKKKGYRKHPNLKSSPDDQITFKV